LKKLKLQLLLHLLEELLLLPLPLERETFKHQLLPLLPLPVLLLLLPHPPLLLQSFQNFKKLLTLSLYETNRVIEFLETISLQNFVIKLNNLNFYLKKLNLHRSCNKEF